MTLPDGRLHYDPQRVVDVYFDASSPGAYLIYRRGDCMAAWVPKDAGMSTLGRCVREALRARRAPEWDWRLVGEDFCPSVLLSPQMAVVFRSDGQTMVGTPGLKGELLRLADQPKHEELGLTVAAQAVAR